jgi:hypothetical protein
MKLASAAAFFDKQVCYDACNPSSKFMAQLDLFDDSKRDGTTPVRRVLSVKPSVNLPTSGTVIVGNDTYIIGGRHDDLFNGAVIRSKYVMQVADGPATIYTLAQAAAGTGGTSTFAGRVWLKDLKEPEQSSGLFPYFNLYLPANSTCGPNNVMALAGKFYFVRTAFTSPGGFRACESSELLDDAIGTIAYTDRSGRTYNPATDTVAALAVVNCSAVVLRYEDSFLRNSAAAPKNEAGDVTLAVAKVLVSAPGPGDTWVKDGVTYRVKSVNDDGGTSWLLHSSRA